MLLETEIPLRERKEIDIEAEEYDAHSFSVAKKINELPRHELPHRREEDGAVALKKFGVDACLAVRVITVLVNSNMAQSFAEGRRSQEKIPVLCGTELF